MRQKALADLLAAGRAGEIDVGEYHVDCDVGLTKGDRLFAARRLDNGVPRFPQFVGHPASHEEVVLDEENDPRPMTICLRYSHQRTFGQAIELGAETVIGLWVQKRSVFGVHSA